MHLKIENLHLRLVHLLGVKIEHTLCVSIRTRQYSARPYTLTIHQAYSEQIENGLDPVALDNNNRCFYIPRLHSRHTALKDGRHSPYSEKETADIDGLQELKGCGSAGTTAFLLTQRGFVEW